MTSNGEKLFDELKEEHKREFRFLLMHDKRRDELIKLINVCARKKDFIAMNDTQRALLLYEDELLASYCEHIVKTESFKFSDVMSASSMNDEQKEYFRLLSHTSHCYANLLDNAYQDLTSFLAKFGYAPKTIEIFKDAGKQMRELVCEVFGNLPLEWVDDFDDACNKADVLVKNKMRSFMRQQEKKQTKKKEK